MLLQVYQIRIEYKPGKEMTLPDTLSRFLNNRINDTIDLDVRVDFVRFSRERPKDTHKKTNKGPVLNHLHKTIITGWPETIKELPHPQ